MGRPRGGGDGDAAGIEAGRVEVEHREVGQQVVGGEDGVVPGVEVGLEIRVEAHRRHRAVGHVGHLEGRRGCEPGGGVPWFEALLRHHDPVDPGEAQRREPERSEPFVDPPGAVVGVHRPQAAQHPGPAAVDGLLHLGPEVGVDQLLDVHVDVGADQHGAAARGAAEGLEGLRPLPGQRVERLGRRGQGEGRVRAVQGGGQGVERGAVPEVGLAVGLEGGRRLRGLDPRHRERGGVAVGTGRQPDQVGQQPVELAVGPVEGDRHRVDGGRRAQPELVARKADRDAPVDLARQ